MRNDLNKSINSIGGTELDFSSLLKLNNKYDNEKNEKSKYSFVHFNNNNISSISPEINVIGENGDSAIAFWNSSG